MKGRDLAIRGGFGLLVGFGCGFGRTGPQQVIDAEGAVGVAHHLGLQTIDSDGVGLHITLEQRQQCHTDPGRVQAGRILLGLVGLGQANHRQRHPHAGEQRQLEIPFEGQRAFVAVGHEAGNLRLEIVDIDKTDRNGCHDHKAQQYANGDRQLLDHDWTPISEFRRPASVNTPSSTGTGCCPCACRTASRRCRCSAPGSTAP